MAVEIEAKMTVASLDEVRDRVKARGATPAGRHLETNAFFDTEDRSLLAGDEGLRLRRNQDVDSGERSHVITYKGPRQQGRLKSREELELSVADFDDAVRLLERLGFLRMLTFEKRRESWSLDGCKVELDELPYLGRFVEVEGPSEEQVLRVRESLALADRPIIKASYIALLMAHLQERGSTAKEVMFASESA